MSVRSYIFYTFCKGSYYLLHYEKFVSAVVENSGREPQIGDIYISLQGTDRNRYC